MAYTTINKPTDYFSSNLYTGTGSALTVTTGHQSDFIWIKQRTTVRPHCLFDSVNSSNFAGGNSKYLVSNTTAALTSNNATQITANSSTGFSIGTDNSDQINNNGDTAVAWSWKANGAGSSNTDGSITSTVSANTTSGFSIAQWTGTGSNATIGHGLGVTPKCFIVKKTSGTSAWSVYHESVGNTKFLNLNGTGAATTSSTVWNNTSPTSSVFSVGTADNGNASGATYIGYFFADVQGYSKMGSYVANGNVNGPFVYTGFKPAFVMIKGDADEAWRIVDSKRLGYNVDNRYLTPNDATAESGSVSDIDLLSNGFKLRSAAGNYNSGSLYNYIYMAFASEPLVSTNGNAATAR